ncbi:hypothetical protein ACFQ4X_03225 [Fictibacillus halophilus]
MELTHCQSILFLASSEKTGSIIPSNIIHGIVNRIRITLSVSS